MVESARSVPQSEPEPGASAPAPSHPAPLQDDDPRVREAIFRFGAIADLVTRVLERGELSVALREAARRVYASPHDGEVRVAERTLWDWLADYRRSGLVGLLPKKRSDAGALRALSQEAFEFAKTLRLEDRARSAADIVDMLVRAGKAPPGSVSRQAVDRALRRADLERIRPGRKPEKVRRRIEVSRPNELWLGDYHDPLAIPLESGGVLRCHNSAWIDHKSRFVPYSAYYRSQALYTLEDCFKKAVLRAGRPERAYVDNAKIYRSAAFAFACDRIHTQLVHSKAYDSACRGAIERFWGDGDVGAFERELVRRGARDLEEVNALYWAWLDERYHRRPHAETGAPPPALREGFEPDFPSVELLSELFLVVVRRKVDRKFATVEVDGVAFHVDPSLRKKLVQVHYDPHDLSSVVIYYDGRRIQRAPRAPPNVVPESSRPAAPVAPSSGFDYLGQLLVDHERRRFREGRAISFAAIEARAREPRPFGRDDLERHLEVALARPLKPADRAATRELLERFGPLDEAVVAHALARAQTARGRGLHVSVYLDFVKAFHLERGDPAP
jgi:transposase InsO family protein